VTFPDDFNLADYYLFDRERQGQGGNIALRFGDRRWTYTEVAHRSRGLARSLVARGLAPEQRVHVVLPDVPPFAWSIFGLLAAGGVLTMGNPLSPPDDLEYVLGYVKAQVLITTPEVAEQLVPRMARLPHLRHVLLAPSAATGDDPEATVALTGPLAALGAAGVHTASLDQVIAAGAAADAPRLPALRRDDPAIWLFTSGSTGRPKAAMHSHRDFAFNTEVYAKRTLGYAESDVTISVARLFFGYGTGTNLWFPFAVGATVALFSERPTAEVVADAIARYRPTIVTNVPTMLGKLLDLDDERRAAGQPGLDLSSVRFHLSAGEALPAPLLRRFVERFGGQIYDGIGSAEMFHIYCSNRPGDVVPGSLGRVVEGYTLKILPDDAEGPGAPALPPNEIGVLWVKGDSVAHGYFQDRDKSWSTFHGHWCRTGDLFQIDLHGYLWFSGRADDLFKVGGVFVARPEAKGQAGGVLANELKAHVQGKLSKHKYPRWVVFVDDLPRNDRGKVDKRQLIERERRGELGETW